MNSLLPYLASTLAAAFMLLGMAPEANAQLNQLPRQLDGVSVDEHLGEYVAREAKFTDHNGEEVTIGDYLDDGVPVMLTMNYYSCEMLCNLQLNALLQGLKGLEWTPGDEFKIVTVSIDPREDVALAQKKRATYFEEYDRGEVDWNFLVGDEAQSRLLANSVGFGFRYDADQDQYAHVAAVMFLSPEGKVTRYLYGLRYRPFDLKMAISEASDGTVGDPLERVILSCFHYDAASGRYDIWAFGVMRLGGVAIVILLGGFLSFLWWRDVRKRRRPQVG